MDFGYSPFKMFRSFGSKDEFKYIHTNEKLIENGTCLTCPDYTIQK